MDSFSVQPWRDRGYHTEESYHPSGGRSKLHGLLPTPSDRHGTRYADQSEQRSWARTDGAKRWEAETDDKWPSNYHPGQHAHQENGYVERWERDREKYPPPPPPPPLAERTEEERGSQVDYHSGPISNWKPPQPGHREGSSGRREVQNFPTGPVQRPRIRLPPQDHRQFHPHRSFNPPPPPPPPPPPSQPSGRFQERPQFQPDRAPPFPDRPQFQDRMTQFRDGAQFHGHTNYSERTPYQDRGVQFRDRIQLHERLPPEFRNRPHGHLGMPSPQSSVESEGSPLPRDPRTKAFSHSVQHSSDSEGDARERPSSLLLSQPPPVADGDLVAAAPRDPREPRGRPHHPVAATTFSHQPSPANDFPPSRVRRPRAFSGSGSMQEDPPWPNHSPQERLPGIHVRGSPSYHGNVDYHHHGHSSPHEHSSPLQKQLHPKQPYPHPLSHPPHLSHHDHNRPTDPAVSHQGRSGREGRGSPERCILSSANPVCERYPNLADPREAANTRKAQPFENRTLSSSTSASLREAGYSLHERRAFFAAERCEIPRRRNEADRHSMVSPPQSSKTISGSGSNAVPPTRELSRSYWMAHDHCYCGRTISLLAALSRDIRSRAHSDRPGVQREAERSDTRSGARATSCFGASPANSRQSSSAVNGGDVHPGLVSSSRQTDTRTKLLSLAERSSVRSTLSSSAGKDLRPNPVMSDHNYASQVDCSHHPVSLPSQGLCETATTSPAAIAAATALDLAKPPSRLGKKVPGDSLEQSKRASPSFDSSMDSPIIIISVDDQTAECEFTRDEYLTNQSPEPSLSGFDLDLESETSGDSEMESASPESPAVSSLCHAGGFAKALDSAVAAAAGRARLRNGHVHTTNLSLYASRGAPCRSVDDKLLLNNQGNPPTTLDWTPPCNPCDPCDKLSPSGRSTPSLITVSYTPSPPTDQSNASYGSLHDGSGVTSKESGRDSAARLEDGDSEVEIIDLSSPPPPPPPQAAECRPSGRGRGTRRRRRGSHTPFRPQKRPRKVVEGSLSPTAKKRTNPFKDFVPEILATRSRAETAMLTRRRVMAEEIDKHERERISTARPGEEARLLAAVDTGHHCAGSLMSLADDSSATESLVSSSRDLESAKSITLDEFSPDLIQSCKRMIKPKNKGVTGGSGDSPLHRLCRKGKLEMARYLVLVEKMAVDVQDHAGWTPLHEACNNGHIEVVEFLLKSGADPNVGALDGTRAIHDAVETGMLEMVRVLVEHGADPCTEHLDKTPCEIAQALGHTEIHGYLRAVIAERNQNSLQSESTKVQSNSAPLVPATRPERVVKESSADHRTIFLPFDGYLEPRISPELDHPLVYVSPVVEMSSEAMLPVYNITLSDGMNPRRHNFYVLSEVAEALGASVNELVAQGIPTYRLPVDEFCQQTRSNVLANSAQLCCVQSLCHSGGSDGEFVLLAPVCVALRRLLGIHLANLDD